MMKPMGADGVNMKLAGVHLAITKRLVAVFFVIIAGPLMMGMGEKYTKEGHALAARVYQVLIQEGYCADLLDCQKKESFYGGHGNRVNLYFYGITDRKLIATVLATVVSEGVLVTHGAPITIEVYQKPHAEYLGLKSLFKKPMINLEVNN